MPDLESFLVSAKNQDNVKSGIQRKKKSKKKGSKSDMDEEDVEETISSKIQN